MRNSIGLWMLLHPVVWGLFNRRDLPAYVSDRRFAIDRVDKGAVIRSEIGEISIERFIKGGAFGHVFQGTLHSPSRGSVPVAAKCQRPDAPMLPFRGMIPKQYSMIEHEFKMMQMMSGTVGFPIIYTGNFKGREKCYVMQLLGKSLESIRTGSPNQRMHPAIVLPMAIQMINRIEALHKMGYLAYDLHLGNFLYKTGTVYLIDLGLAYPYVVDGHHIKQTGSHIPGRMKNHALTTRHDAMGVAYSRRDDIERVLILVVYMLAGRLPWTNVRKEHIVDMKTRINARSMTRDVPWMRRIMQYVFDLGFEDEPDYEFIRNEIEAKLRQV